MTPFCWYKIDKIAVLLEPIFWKIIIKLGPEPRQTGQWEEERLHFFLQRYGKVCVVDLLLQGGLFIVIWGKYPGCKAYISVSAMFTISQFNTVQWGAVKQRLIQLSSMHCNGCQCSAMQRCRDMVKQTCLKQMLQQNQAQYSYSCFIDFLKFALRRPEIRWHLPDTFLPRSYTDSYHLNLSFKIWLFANP